MYYYFTATKQDGSTFDGWVRGYDEAGARREFAKYYSTATLIVLVCETTKD